MDIFFSFAAIIGLLAFVFALYWMIQMLKTTREQRILTSIQLKLTLELLKSKGIHVDMKKLHDEVVASM